MSLFPSEVAVAIYHFDSTAKIWPGTADITTSGFVIAMDRKDHALEGISYSDPKELYLDQSVAVRASDKVVISSATYYVKQIFNADVGGMQHKRCSLTSEV